MADPAEKTFEMLKAGMPPEEVGKVVGSGSQYKKGAQHYLECGTAEIEVIQKSNHVAPRVPHPPCPFLSSPPALATKIFKILVGD